MILIACEESQRVCAAFRARGLEAYSCDVIEPSGNHPEWHIKQDVLPLLNGNCSFTTMDGTAHQLNGKWDMIIAFPPCTYLTISGNRWFNVERYGDKALERMKLREEASKFFLAIANADCDLLAIENPIGYMNSHWRKPDQMIQPYMFGHEVSKKTCLWLKGLPKLKPTNIVEPERIHSKGKSGGYSGNSWYVKKDGKILPWNHPETAKARSKTFEGIAEAMASQWGDFYETNS